MININSVGLLIVDLQNDFLHSQGAYGRAGLKNSDIGALPSRIAPIANKLKMKDGWIVSTQWGRFEQIADEMDVKRYSSRDDY